MADNSAADAAEKEGTEEQEAVVDAEESEEFDQQRAMATIKKQREAEAAAKERAKELEKELAKYREADDAKAEAEKALEVKVAERDEALKAKDVQIADLHVKFSFDKEAREKGIADPALAFLAAKEQGLLGAFDPKEGKVSDHDWDKLGELYPSFAAQESSPTAKTGDAGARGKGVTKTASDQFNDAVRGALSRR